MQNDTQTSYIFNTYMYYIRFFTIVCAKAPQMQYNIQERKEKTPEQSNENHNSIEIFIHTMSSKRSKNSYQGNIIAISVGTLNKINCKLFSFVSHCMVGYFIHVSLVK